MLATSENQEKHLSQPKAGGRRVRISTHRANQCHFSVAAKEKEIEKSIKINLISSHMIFTLLKNELRSRAESGGDLAPFKKLPKALKEKLIVAIEDEEDIADTEKVMMEIKTGKAKLIPWEKIKKKYGL